MSPALPSADSKPIYSPRIMMSIVKIGTGMFCASLLVTKSGITTKTTGVSYPQVCPHVRWSLEQYDTLAHNGGVRGTDGV